MSNSLDFFVTCNRGDFSAYQELREEAETVRSQEQRVFLRPSVTLAVGFEGASHRFYRRTGQLVVAVSQVVRRGSASDAFDMHYYGRIELPQEMVTTMDDAVREALLDFPFAAGSLHYHDPSEDQLHLYEEGTRAHRRFMQHVMD